MLIDSHLPGQYLGYLVSGDADEDAQQIDGKCHLRGGIKFGCFGIAV
jgi:hypothetical protein